MIKKLLLLLSTLTLACLSLQSLAARGGEKGPSDRAYERASDNASFKRDGNHKDQHEKHDSDDDKKNTRKVRKTRKRNTRTGMMTEMTTGTIARRIKAPGTTDYDHQSIGVTGA